MDGSNRASSFIVGGATGQQTLASGGNTLSFSQPSLIKTNGQFQLGGGGLFGVSAGTLTVSGQFTWNGGFLGGGNTWLTVATNGVLTLAGVNGSAYPLGEYLTNAGTINLASGDLNIDWCGTNYGALINLAGATVNFQTDVSITNSCNGPGFSNAGSVIKSGGTGVSTIGSTFNSTGSVVVQSGTMALADGGNLGGILQAASGSALYETNFTVSAALTIVGTVNFVGGTVANTGSLTVPANGVLNLVGNTFYISGPLTNMGTVNWLGGGITVINGNNSSYSGGIWNQAGAQWNIECNQTLNNDYATGYEIFHNAGLLSKANVSGTTPFDVYLDNSGGTVQAQVGTIQFNSGSNLTGTFQAVAGSAIYFSGGSFLWNGTASFQGNVQITGGSVSVTTSVASLPYMSGVTISGLSNVVGTITLNGATIAANRETLAGAAYLTNCAFAGNESLGGNVSLAGGSLASGSSVTVMGTGVLNLVAGGNTFALLGPLTNNGTVNMQGGALQIENNNSANYAGGIWNQPGAQWNLEGAETFYSYFNNGYEILHNAGLLTQNVAGTTACNVYFDNTAGVVTAQAGTIQFNNGSNLTGTFTATAVGTGIYFTGGNLVWNGTANFQGNVKITGGSLTVNGTVSNLPAVSGVTISGLSNVVGPISLTGATLTGNRETLSGTAYLTNCSFSGNETFAGTVSLAGGYLSASGSLTVAGTGVLNLVSGGNTFGIVGPFTNNGTVNWSGGALQIENNNSANYAGAIWNQAGAQWNLESTVTLYSYFNSGYEIFHNAGQLVQTAAGTTTFNVDLDNSGGAVQAQMGTIQFNNGSNLAGTFAATATGTAIDFTGGNFNWNGAPNFQGNVQVNGGTVTVTGSVAALPPMNGVTISGLSNVLGTITLTGATITGNRETLSGAAYFTNCSFAGNETFAGTVAIAGGNLSASGSLTVASPGVLNLVTGGNTFTIVGPLTNNGTVNWSGSALQIENNNSPNYAGAIWNQAGAQWNLDSTTTLFSYFNNGYEIFHNAGLLDQNAAGTTTFGVYLDNTGGTVQAQTGTIQFANGSNLSGSFLATAAGTAIYFTSGNYPWSGTPNFQGNVQITGGTVAIIGSTPSFAATSAYLSGLSNVLNTAALTNCVITGAERIVCTVNWAAGSISGSGSLTVAGSGILNLLPNSGTFYITGPLTNNGIVNWLGGAVEIQNNNSANYAGSIWNQAGAQWNLQSAQTLYNYFNTGYEIFHNAGLLSRNTVIGTTTFNVYLDNAGGTVQAQVGTIIFANGSNLAGTFQALVAGTAINFTGGTFTWTGSPNFQGNEAISGGTVNITGVTPGLAATGVYLSGLSNIVNNAWLTNCVLRGAESIGATVYWAGGSLQAGGSLTIGKAGVLNLVTGGYTFGIVGPLTNFGTVDWQGGAVQVENNNSANYAGGIWNQPGAQWDIQWPAALYSYFNNGFELFQNAGLISQSGSTGTTTFQVSLNDNGGTLDVQSGLINFTGNPAYVEAGETLDFGIAATNNYGQISVAGNVNFDGTLTVNLLNGYVPPVGAAFTLFNYGTHGGNFANLNLPILPGSQAWKVDYGAALVLRVVAAGSNDTLSISGIVTNTSGAPIPGATVYAFINANTFTNPIVNGSFEVPSIGGAPYFRYYNGSTNVTGWVVVGPTNDNIDICSYNSGPAEDGNQYLDPTGSTGGAGMTQTFPTVPGQTYALNFFHGTITVHNYPKVLGVTVGTNYSTYGETPGSSANLAWKPELIPFVATSNLTTVTFTELTGTDANDGYVDNVQVTPIDYGRVLEAVTGTDGRYQIAVANGTFQVGVSGLPALGYNNVTEQTVVVSNANQTASFAAPAATVAQQFTIVTAANPPGSGTTGGGGTFGSGAVATVTATPVTSTLPYLFSSWTENGVFQSATNNYSFTVIRSRNLVANFTLPLFTVTASNNPANAGVISGAGSFFYGATNVLSVVPNFGFVFTNWTEAGSIVGTTPTLTTLVFTNHNFVANFIDANINHVITTVTAPPGLTTVAGAGTYTNGQTATFNTPQFVTNSPYFYVFQQYTVSNTVVSSTNTFTKTFSTLDATNLQYVAVYKTMTILPAVTNVSANYSSPVPATTNFLLSLQFDRSMNTNIMPTVILTNAAAAVQPVVMTNGFWSATVRSNDTYHVPPVVFAPGMDGTMQLFVSGAQDATGGILALTNAATFTIQATPPPAPVLSLVSSNSSSVTIAWAGYAAPANLAGFRVYIENTNYNSLASVPVYTSLGSSSRSYTYYGLLLNTNYYLAIQAVDTVGNALTAVTPFSIYLPSTVPPPVSIQVTATGASSALVSWSSYNASALLGFSGYQIYYEPTNFTSVAGLVPQATAAVYSTSIQINGLSRLQTNYFAVVGYNNTNGFNPNVTTVTWSDPYAGTISANTTIGGASPGIVNIYKSINVVNNAQLTVASGTTLLFAPGTSLTVSQGALIANGTALQPIIFDSANDVPGLTPAPGDWGGITLGGGAGSSSLEFVEVLHGGGLTVSGCSPAVQAFTGNQNAPWGLGLTNGASLTTTAALLSGNVVGAEQFGSSLLTIGSSVIQNNTTNACAAGSQAMYAVSNYWGTSVASGIAPLVAGNVTYTPFLTYEPLLTPAIGTSNGVTQVGGSSVNLQLACRTAVSMRLSEDFTFAGVFFSPYTNYDNFALSMGGGQKHIFAQFRSITGATNTPIELDVNYVTAGPVIQSFNLSDGETLSRPVTVTGSATATLGMQDLEFYVDGIGLATNTGGSFSYYFDVRTLNNAVHVVQLLARDTSGNVATLQEDVVVAVTPPPAPFITSPAADYITNNATLTVRGTAEPRITVEVTDNGQVLGSPTADLNGTFAITNATLQEGVDTLVALATDSSGITPSVARHVTVETIPPVAVIMNQPVYTPGSGLSLSWQFATSGKQPTTFELFWNTSSFTSTNQAAHHSVPLLVTSDTLQGLANGTYYFGVVGFDAAGNPSPLSGLVSTVYNSTPPALSISYGSPSPVGPGPLAITLSSSSAVAGTPTLTIQPAGGSPVSLNLTNVALNLWQTTLDITAATPSGTASVQAAAQDSFGNVFNGAPAGVPLVIDTTPPAGTIVTVPPGPVQTLNPTNVSISLALSKLEQAGLTPSLSFQAPIGTHTPIALTGAGTNWSGTLALTPAMSSGFGKFTLSAQDNVGNTGTNILSGSQLELYDSALPAPPTDPLGLSAVSLPGGYIRLSWNPVGNAQFYRLYREPGTNFIQPGTLDIDNITNDTVTDFPTNDGYFAYAVSASRDGSESGLASALIAVSDRTPPPAPTNVVVALAASGLQISWQQPAGEVPNHYNVYRNGTLVTATGGTGPVVDYPPRGTNIYIVDSSDAIGNLNPGAPVTNVLLVSPVDSLSVLVTQGQAVQLSWVATDATATGFDVFRNGVLQNATPLATTNYTDLLGLSDAVTYSVTAVNASAQQSPGRLVNVYPLKLGLVINPVNNPILVNYFDEYLAGITNLSTSAGMPLAQLVLNRLAGGAGALVVTQAVPAVIAAGASVQPVVIVPEPSVVATQSVQMAVYQQTDSQGSSVVYVNTFNFTNAQLPGVEIAVATSQVPLAGGLATFQAEINNPSSVPIDIVTSRADGSKPGDLYIAVENAYGQVVSQTPFQATPPGTIFLGDGRGYVQINPGASMTLTVSNVLVPAALAGSTNTTFAAVVTNIYSQIGTSREVDSGPLSGSVSLSSLAVPPYNGTAQTPQSVYDNDQPIVISGQAISTSTGLPVPNVPLNIGFATRGYVWFQSVTTDASGNYQYTYNPVPGFAGTLAIWAANPLVVDQLNQVSVTVYRAYCNPDSGEVKMSKNGTVDFTIQLLNPGNVPLTGFAVSCAAYQAVGTNLTPITTLTGTSLTPAGFTLPPNQSQTVTLQLAAALTAPSSAEAVFTFTSAEGATATLTTTVSLLPAVPAINVVSPAAGYVEANVDRGAQISSQVTIVNSGLTTLQGITITPPTNIAWMQLNLPISSNGVINLPDLPQGQSNTFTVVYTPPATTPLAEYQDDLVINGTNLTVPYRLNLYAIVTSDLTGSAQFQVEDFLGDYLEGASIRLQNNLIQASAGPFMTDTNGLATITNLTEGVWNWQASAPGRSSASGTLTITADQTAYQNPVLVRSLVTITFSVVPVPFTDQYQIQVNQTFSTFVPVPELVVSPPYTSFPATPGFQATLDLTAQDAGLIKISDINITGQQSSVATLTPLITYLPVLMPQQSVDIPFAVTYSGPSGPGQQDLSDCLPGGNADLLGAFAAGLAALMAGAGDCPEAAIAIKVAGDAAIAFAAYQAITGAIAAPLEQIASAIGCLIGQLLANGGDGSGSGDGGGAQAQEGTLIVPTGSGCFTPETMVLMANGTSEPISQVHTNDLVRSGSRSDNLAKVSAVCVFEASSIEEIDFTNLTKTALSQKVLATPEHFFWVDGSGWKSGAELRAGDYLFDAQDHRLRISGIKLFNKNTKVYTLKLSGADSFYANNILVHDLCGTPPPMQTARREVTP